MATETNSEWTIVARKDHVDSHCCKYGAFCRGMAVGRCPFVHPGQTDKPGAPYVLSEREFKKIVSATKKAAAAAASESRAVFMESFPVLSHAPRPKAATTSGSYAAAAAVAAAATKPEVMPEAKPELGWLSLTIAATKPVAAVAAVDAVTVKPAKPTLDVRDAASIHAGWL